MSNGQKREIDASAFREAVKLIYGYLTVLAITNSVRIFAEQFTPSETVAPPFPDQASLWVTFSFSVLLILRFFFGNIAHFNSDEDSDVFEIVFDSIVILLQAIMIGYATFFLTDLSQYFVIVNLVFLVDLIWFAITSVVATVRRKPIDLDRRVGVSQFVSIITFSCFWFLNFSSIGWHGNLIFIQVPATIESAIVAYLVINTSVDLFVNGRRYINFREP